MFVFKKRQTRQIQLCDVECRANALRECTRLDALARGPRFS